MEAIQTTQLHGECVVDLSVRDEAQAQCLVVPEGCELVLSNVQVVAKVSQQQHPVELLQVELISEQLSVSLSVRPGDIDESGRRIYGAALSVELKLCAGVRLSLRALRSLGSQIIGPAYCHLTVSGRLVPLMVRPQTI